MKKPLDRKLYKWYRNQVIVDYPHNPVSRHWLQSRQDMVTCTFNKFHREWIQVAIKV